jgi:hypothetical protein
VASNVPREATQRSSVQQVVQFALFALLLILIVGPLAVLLRTSFNPRERSRSEQRRSPCKTTAISLPGRQRGN